MPESPGSKSYSAGIPGIELRASRNPRDRHSVVRKYKVANAGIPGIEVVQCRNPRDRTSSEPESPGSAQRRTKIQSSKCRNPRDRSRTMPESPGSARRHFQVSSSFLCKIFLKLIEPGESGQNNCSCAVPGDCLPNDFLPGDSNFTLQVP